VTTPRVSFAELCDSLDQPEPVEVVTEVPLIEDALQILGIPSSTTELARAYDSMTPEQRTGAMESFLAEGDDPSASEIEAIFAALPADAKVGDSYSAFKVCTHRTRA
jgi:hypothetical protein